MWHGEWRTILHKRAGYRAAFAGFDAGKVARLTVADQHRLRQDASIVRNRLKISSAITNARRFLELQEQAGSFDRWLWSWVDGEPIVKPRRSPRDVPVSTPLSDAISKDLKHRGFKFVGTTITYAYLQAVGVVDDHLVGCHRR